MADEGTEATGGSAAAAAAAAKLKASGTTDGGAYVALDNAPDEDGDSAVV